GRSVVLAAGWLKRRGRIRAEAMRRLRMRRLALRRLDPRRNYTPAHAAELQRLSDESNVPNPQLHAILVDRAETALTADPGVDYTPLPPRAEPTQGLGEPGPAEHGAQPPADGTGAVPKA